MGDGPGPDESEAGGSEAHGPEACGQPAFPRDPTPLSQRQRLLLFFNTTTRKFWAGATLAALWFLLMVLLDDHPYMGPIPSLVLFSGTAVLWVLFTHGSGLSKPAPMPADIMRQDAPGRFSKEEEWDSPLPAADALKALQTVFRQPGVQAGTMDRSLWVELDKEWKAAEWWHRDAARLMKRRPALQFFVEAAGGGSRVSAFSVDRTFGGLYDVVKLSDEMSASAVEIARETTGAPQGKPPKGRQKWPLFDLFIGPA